MTAANIMNLVIDDRARSYAKIYASLLKDEFQRKRAYASIVALYALINAVEKTDNDVQKTMTLFRNPVLNEEYEITDVYINNWHVDVRVITDGDAFLVPKSHYDNDLQPDFYAVIKVDKNLTQAELLGFCNTSTAQKEPLDYHYYSITLNSLISYDEFLSKVNTAKLVSFTEDEHEFFRTSYLSLLDEELDSATKNRLLKHLFNCPLCRTEFCCFTGFEMVNCNIGKYPDLLDDQMLNVIGAQDVDNEKYAEKEETIYIGSDEEKEQSDDSPQQGEESEAQLKEQPSEKIVEEETKEETVSDILDELFNIEEDFIEAEPVEEKPIVTPQPTISDSGDLEIFEDNTEMELEAAAEDENALEIIEESSNSEQNDDIEVLEDSGVELIQENNNEEEVVFLDSEPENFAEEDLEIHENTDEELDISQDSASVISDEIPAPDDNVQKVIVDYDEYGEPIYSYITNVGQETLEDTPSAIEPLDDDDDILNEKFETYPQEEIEDDLSSINNGSARPIEYVQNNETPDVEEINDEGSDDISEEILSENADNVQEKSEFEEYKDDDVISENTEEAEFEEYSEDEAPDEEEMNDLASMEKNELENEEVSEEQVEEYDEYDEYDESSASDDEQDYEQDEEYDEEYDEDDVEIPEENVAKPIKPANLIITSLLVLLVVIGGGVGAFLFMKKNNAEPVVSAPADNNVETSTGAPQIDDMFEAAEDSGIEIPAADDNAQSSELPPAPQQNAAQNETIDIPQLTEQDLLKPEHTPRDVSASLANAFSPTSNSVSLRAVNWLCSPQLFTDNAFKAYLQNLDNIVKLNLRKNILDVTETPQNSTVTVKMAVENSGNLNRVAISESSGSEQIDNIVLQSINESFEGEKSQILNDSAQKADMYYLKLVIKL